MSGLGKKSAAFVDGDARTLLDSVSKAALIDLVVDLLRRNAGDETLSGDDLAAAFTEAFEPVAVVRGDKVPTLAGVRAQRAKIEAKLARWAAADAARCVPCNGHGHRTIAGRPAVSGPVCLHCGGSGKVSPEPGGGGGGNAGRHALRKLLP